MPTSDDQTFNFTAEVPVQQLPEVADWSTLEVPAAEPEVPTELVDQELEALRASVAELIPVEDRPAKDGDVLVIDLVDESGEAQRDFVVQLGAGRLLEELERGLRGMNAGETKTITFAGPDGAEKKAEVTVKEIKEPVLPPLDDELAKSASEFETLAELREEIETRLRDLVEAELNSEFRSAAVDRSGRGVQCEPSPTRSSTRGPTTCSPGCSARSSAAASTSRPISSSQASRPSNSATPCAPRLASRSRVSSSSRPSPTSSASRSPTTRSKTLIREQAEGAGEDAEDLIKQVWERGRPDRLRDDLRLRNALDRIAAEVKRDPRRPRPRPRKHLDPGAGKTRDNDKVVDPR